MRDKQQNLITSQSASHSHSQPQPATMPQNTVIDDLAVSCVSPASGNDQGVVTMVEDLRNPHNTLPDDYWPVFEAGFRTYATAERLHVLKDYLAYIEVRRQT